MEEFFDENGKLPHDYLRVPLWTVYYRAFLSFVDWVSLCASIILALYLAFWKYIFNFILDLWTDEFPDLSRTEPTFGVLDESTPDFRDEGKDKSQTSTSLPEVKPPSPFLYQDSTDEKDEMNGGRNKTDLITSDKTEISPPSLFKYKSSDSIVDDSLDDVKMDNPLNAQLPKIEPPPQFRDKKSDDGDSSDTSLDEADKEIIILVGDSDKLKSKTPTVGSKDASLDGKERKVAVLSALKITEIASLPYESKADDAKSSYSVVEPQSKSPSADEATFDDKEKNVEDVVDTLEITGTVSQTEIGKSDEKLEKASDIVVAQKMPIIVLTPDADSKEEDTLKCSEKTDSVVTPETSMPVLSSDKAEQSLSGSVGKTTDPVTESGKTVHSPDADSTNERNLENADKKTIEVVPPTRRDNRENIKEHTDKTTTARRKDLIVNLPGSSIRDKSGKADNLKTSLSKKTSTPSKISTSKKSEASKPLSGKTEESSKVARETKPALGKTEQSPKTVSKTKPANEKTEYSSHAASKTKRATGKLEESFKSDSKSKQASTQLKKK